MLMGAVMFPRPAHSADAKQCMRKTNTVSQAPFRFSDPRMCVPHVQHAAKVDKKVNDESVVSIQRIQAIPVQSSSSPRLSNLRATEPPQHQPKISVNNKNETILPFHSTAVKTNNTNETNTPKPPQDGATAKIDKKHQLRHDVLTWKSAAGGPVLFNEISLSDDLPVDFGSEPWLFVENANLSDNVCVERSCSGDTYEVTIDKGAGGYGLGVTEARGSLYVCCVKHGSVAWQAGIRFGHKLVEINGQSTHQWSHQTAKMLISSSDHLTLRIELPADRKTARIDRPYRHYPLGFLLEGGNVITNVEEGTLAFKAGMEAGWCIVAVGDVCTVGADKNDMKLVMDKAGLSLAFTLLPKSLHEDITALMGPDKIKFLTGQLEIWKLALNIE